MTTMSERDRQDGEQEAATGGRAGDPVPGRASAQLNE